MEIALIHALFKSDYISKRTEDKDIEENLVHTAVILNLIYSILVTYKTVYIAEFLVSKMCVAWEIRDMTQFPLLTTKITDIFYSNTHLGTGLNYSYLFQSSR